ncbi:MAG: DUF3667 domain-containing protein [Flavobacteriaceae bacterium]|nr:DUF3667 domain-containing protein [Bacteroidia bacterium]NNF75376.1 DUF3667 domain-containing protein [Flavobacteriaceae bacterium]
MSESTVSCKNCNKEFKEGFEFCPHCGQKAKDDLTLGVLFYNTISNYFSFDARFIKSFLPLMFRPGYVAKQFVSGKRLLYLHPAQYYLFVSVVFFFLFSFKVREYNSNVDKALKKSFDSESVVPGIDMKPLDSMAAKELSESIKKNQAITGMSDEDVAKLDSIMVDGNNNPGNLTFSYDKNKVDSLIAIDAKEPEILKAMGMKDNAGFFVKRFYQQLLKFQKNSGGGIVQAFFDSIPIALFILLPIFAVLLKIFYWRRGRFSHHLVFSFYFFSFLFILMSLIIGVNYIVEIPDWIDWLIILSSFFYLWLALRNFYQQGLFLSLIKSGFISFFYMLLILPLALTVMITASFFFY